MRKKKILTTYGSESIVPPIVWDSLIATVDSADGRLIPLVIIDTSNRPDIENLMEIHSKIGSGDVESVWLQDPKRKKTLGLALNFLNPTSCMVILQFDLLQKYGLIDCIVRAQGLYIQCGREGDRLATTFHNKRILIEVPSKEFQKEWNQIFQESAETKFMESGLSRKEAKVAAQAFISEWRKLNSFRMNDY